MQRRTARPFPPFSKTTDSSRSPPASSKPFPPEFSTEFSGPRKEKQKVLFGKESVAPSKWTEEEDRKLFTLYKQEGSAWSTIAREFPGKTERSVKNRFYSTLRRIARKKNKSTKCSDKSMFHKHNILSYVDEAIEYGHNCFNVRGRPRKTGNGCTKRRRVNSKKGKKAELETSCPCVQEGAIGEEELHLMDTAELPKSEEVLDSGLELCLSYNELVDVNQSVINLLLTEQKLKEFL